MNGVVFGEITAGDQEDAKVHRVALGWHVSLTIPFYIRVEGTRFKSLPTTSRTAVHARTHRKADRRIGTPDDDNEVENEDEEDDAAAVGSKRKGVAQAPRSRHPHGNLDWEAGNAIITKLVADLSEVQELQAQAGSAWEAFCVMSAEDPVHGNDWKRFLTSNKDEEMPEGWNAADLPDMWRNATQR
ncbi:hypothetical protein FRC01_004233 [Tulasnella sp. 417]|nr:hypothetical protein FRC01_004233 [Tulasnella sp. 417]